MGKFAGMLMRLNSVFAILFTSFLAATSVFGQDRIATTRPAVPKEYFLKGKLLGWRVEFFTESLKLVPVGRGAVIAEFWAEKEYGDLSGLGRATGPMSIYDLRLRALPDVSPEDIRRSGSDGFPDCLKKLGITVGATYLVKVAPGVPNWDTAASLTPYSNEAEQVFLRENHEQIEYTVSYIKSIRRSARQQYIDLYEEEIPRLKDGLKSGDFPQASRPDIERRIADDQKKLKELRDTPEDVYPPPSWDGEASKGSPAHPKP